MPKKITRKEVAFYVKLMKDILRNNDNTLHKHIKYTIRQYRSLIEAK